MLKNKICLVGSSGGHLTHLYKLKPTWKKYNRFWVTWSPVNKINNLNRDFFVLCHD